MNRKLSCALIAGLLASCPKDEPPPPDPFVDQREPCAAKNELKEVFFGDLHVHTRYSFDAWVFDIHTRPEDAYSFAKGGPIALPPLGADGLGTRSLSLDRPLDFAAVTDHSEYLGEVEICTTPGLEGHDSRRCELYRQADEGAILAFGSELLQVSPSRFTTVCGTDSARCVDVAQTVWERIQAAAEHAYDRSAACNFTSFVAYEWSGVTDVSNMHRNVIFRNANVPVFPASYFDFPTPARLWSVLKSTCLDGGFGCDVIGIPHNTNWSNGNLFFVDYSADSTSAEQVEAAKLRRDLEPLIEIYQHKGDSECMNGLSGVIGEPDELCDFEKLRKAPFVDCGDETGSGAVGGIGCISRLDFLRGILLEGLKEKRRIGVNPYTLGIIASTDTHNGTPGEVREAGYPGHWGNNEDRPENRLGAGTLTPGGVLYSGGGLTAVWAEENSRNALFESMRRREVYGTSGPRIVLRLFGGWDYPANLCDSAELVRDGYAKGVPMGADLPVRPDGASAPKFVVSALQDPGSARVPGTPLQRIQIIKGSLDAGGQAYLRVYDVAGDKDNGATVDLDNCQIAGPGAASLCTVWTDPDFDPSQIAYYYARVIENPVCRWSRQLCVSLPAADRPAACDDPEVPLTIQERAWSSPIWYDGATGR